MFEQNQIAEFKEVSRGGSLGFPRNPNMGQTETALSPLSLRVPGFRARGARSLSVCQLFPKLSLSLSRNLSLSLLHAGRTSKFLAGLRDGSQFSPRPVSRAGVADDKRMFAGVADCWPHAGDSTVPPLSVFVLSAFPLSVRAPLSALSHLLPGVVN